VRTSRRFHLSLPPDLELDLTTFARRHGLGLGPAIRLLVGNALRDSCDSLHRESADSPAALAALTASEHAVLMVASVLPEGEGRMRTLAERAVEAAEGRLALFRQSASESGDEA